MKEKQTRVSKRMLEKIEEKIKEDNELTQIQWMVYKKLFRKNANSKIAKICGLDRLLVLGPKEYKYGKGKKDQFDNHTSIVSNGLFKHGQERLLYKYFGLCFWVVVCPNVPDGFYTKMINSTQSFVRKDKVAAIQERYRALKLSTRFKENKILYNAVVLLSSCCSQKTISSPVLKIRTKLLNDLIRESKEVLKKNKSAGMA